MLQDFLEYSLLYKHRLFSILTYPQDASKINAKHVVVFKHISDIKKNEDESHHRNEMKKRSK